MSAKEFIVSDIDFKYYESITFYQFVKASDTLPFKDFFDFLKKNGYYNVVFEKIKEKDVIQIIEKHWNNIRNGCDFTDLPNSDNPVKIKKISKSFVSKIGDNELNVIKKFNELIARSITDIDLWMFINFFTIYPKDSAFTVDSKTFNNYNKFMSKYTKTIPYISYLTGFKKVNNEFEVSFATHYFTMKKIDTKLYNFYDSNTRNKNKIKTFKKFPAFIEIYWNEKDKNKDLYEDFINI